MNAEKPLIRWVLRWRHKSIWSMNGNVAYAAEAHELEALRDELNRKNPHLEHKISQYI